MTGLLALTTLSITGSLATPDGFAIALITLAAVGTACAVLSVFVVLLKWSFMGEGLSHAGYAGAGTAALLSLAVPAMGNYGAGYATAVVFCFATAGAIGWVARRRGISGDAAIGVFVVASLAWGTVASSVRPGTFGGMSAALFGSVAEISPLTCLSALAVCVLVLAVVAMMGREILLYCFDQTLARVSGVRVGLIHYLLVFMLAFVTVAGMQLLGYLLAPALLILPGALALAVSVRLERVMLLSISATLAAVAVGLTLAARWPVIQVGPGIVLTLFVEFLAALALRRR